MLYALYTVQRTRFSHLVVAANSVVKCVLCVLFLWRIGYLYGQISHLWALRLQKKIRLMPCFEIWALANLHTEDKWLVDLWAMSYRFLNPKKLRAKYLIYFQSISLFLLQTFLVNRDWWGQYNDVLIYLLTFSWPCKLIFSINMFRKWNIIIFVFLL